MIDYLLATFLPIKAQQSYVKLYCHLCYECLDEVLHYYVVS